MLRSDLEKSIQDISGLFAKIGIVTYLFPKIYGKLYFCYIPYLSECGIFLFLVMCQLVESNAITRFWENACKYNGM
jgi:hypothetical protein